MRFSDSLLGAAVASFNATFWAYQSRSPATPFDPILETCPVNSAALYIIDPSTEPGTIFGAERCFNMLQDRSLEDAIVTVEGSQMERLASFTSRDMALEDVTTIVGVRTLHGMGGSVSIDEVVARLKHGVEWWRRARCSRARCPVTVFSLDVAAGVEMRLWGEKKDDGQKEKKGRGGVAEKEVQGSSPLARGSATEKDKADKSGLSQEL